MMVFLDRLLTSPYILKQFFHPGFSCSDISYRHTGFVFGFSRVMYPLRIRLVRTQEQTTGRVRQHG